MTVRRLFVWLFLCAIFAISSQATLDPDMWWHLRTGEYILQEGIPRQDVFSFSAAEHEWITHEWLSEAIMWVVYQVGGLPALILFFAGINTLAFWFVYQRCAGKPYIAAFTLLLSAFASSIIWGARPQMFNILFTAVFIFIIEGVLRGKLSSRALWWLPPLTAIWANLHSGYFLGVALAGSYALGAAMQRSLAKDDSAPVWQLIRQLGLMTVLSLLAAALNPNGAELWIYPFLTLGSGAMQSYIQEWGSPNFHIAVYWAFAALLFLGVLSWAFSRQKPTWIDIGLLLGTGAAGLLSVRHIPLFALVAAPIVCRHLTDAIAQMPAFSALLRPTDSASGSKALNWTLALLFTAVAMLWAGSVVAQNNDKIEARYPVAAVDYIENQGMAEQRGYNSYNWGGYLIWRGLPVFVDGRADVYGDDFLRTYRQTFDPQPNWQEPLDQYDIDYILMERGDPLTTLLTASVDWREAYQDEIAQIFVRSNEN